MKKTVFALLILLAACSPKPIVIEKIVAPHVPAQLLEPVEIQKRTIEGFDDVGLLMLDLTEGLQQANGKIAAVANILKEEAGPQ